MYVSQVFVPDINYCKDELSPVITFGGTAHHSQQLNPSSSQWQGFGNDVFEGQLWLLAWENKVLAVLQLFQPIKLISTETGRKYKCLLKSADLSLPFLLFFIKAIHKLRETVHI